MDWVRAPASPSTVVLRFSGSVVCRKVTSQENPSFCATNISSRLVWFCYAKASLHGSLHALIKMTTTKSSVKQRVAIVGSGMAGLATAHLLHNDKHQRYSVTVFESVRMLYLQIFCSLVWQVLLGWIVLTRFCVRICRRWISKNCRSHWRPYARLRRRLLQKSDQHVQIPRGTIPFTTIRL